MARYLTKSRFRLALDCPVKLYYTGKPEYPDTTVDDEFLMALAEGGFQVGALAKLYYPGGIEITDRGYDIPLEKTNQLLTRENVIIFEAAFAFENLFIRADIIIKKGKHIDLIEVKSKSFREEDETAFVGRKGGINAGWKPYLYDVAFQKHVIQSAFPQFNVTAYLMLADKDKKATVNGLNQKFFINRDMHGRVFIELEGDTSPEALGDRILTEVNIDNIASGIISGKYEALESGLSFTDTVILYAGHYARDEMFERMVGAQCHGCEFDCTFEDEEKGMRSGFRTCWRKWLHWTDDQFREPHVFDIWYNTLKKHMVEEGIYHMRQLTRDHIGDFKPSEDGALTRNERQWLQVEKTLAADTEPYLDVEGLCSEMSKWKYPLHFIDFETCMVAVPFYKGRKPYEGIAFQFSHHTVDSNGVVRHAGEYINIRLGVFPNFEFIRALKTELEYDEGTIFRYADHENTYLVKIWRQLNDATDIEVPDRRSLMDFIQTITHSPKESTEQWRGERDMVDMLRLVRKYFYHIEMKGSNSIKVVLPAVLKISDYLRSKYSEPAYGSPGGIESRNFKNQTWYQTNEQGDVIDPYKLLGPVFNDIDQETLESMIIDETIADGGAAMTAYARMQFTRMSEDERDLAAKALLRYCELDTFAMVMIYEYWRDQAHW